MNVAAISPDDEAQEMITSGRGPIAAARWMAYRFIHEDLKHSLEMMESGAYAIETPKLD